MYIVHVHVHVHIYVLALTFSSSFEVSVMNLTNSSQPEETETVDVLASIKAFVDTFISSRRPAMVPATCTHTNMYMYTQ